MRLSGVFVSPAEAEIVRDTEIVWSHEISTPVAVRYAWANNPEGANLYNKAGLPASPCERVSFTEREL